MKLIDLLIELVFNLFLCFYLKEVAPDEIECQLIQKNVLINGVVSHLLPKHF